MQTARLLASNTIAQSVSKVATVLTTLIIGRLIASPAQGLGKAGYDDFGIIMAYAAYFYIICDFGLNAVAIKELTAKPDQTAKYLNQLLGLRLALSAGLIILALAVMAFLDYSTTIKLGILISLITITSQAIITNSNMLFQAKLQYWSATIAVVVGSAVSLSLAYLSFRLQLSVHSYVLAVTVGSLVMASLALWLVNLQQAVRPGFDLAFWRRNLLAALPLGAAIILNLIYIRAGFFILSLHDTSDYGLLSAAYRIFDVALVLPVFIINAIYPLLLQRLEQGWPDFKALWRKSLILMVGGGLAVSLGLWLTAPWVINLTVNNPAFQPSITILRHLSLIVPIFFFSNLLLWTTIALGHRKSVVMFYSLGALLSLTLNLWLVPQFSYNAIIGVTAGVELFITLLMAGQLWLIWHKQALPQPDPLPIPEESLT